MMGLLVGENSLMICAAIWTQIPACDIQMDHYQNLPTCFLSGSSEKTCNTLLTDHATYRYTAIFSKCSQTPNEQTTYLCNIHNLYCSQLTSLCMTTLDVHI